MTVTRTAVAVLNTAKSYVGEMEHPVLSNQHPTVSWYNAHVANLGSSWNYCAAGVTRAFVNAGAGDLIIGRAYVPWMMQDFESGVKGGKLIWIDSSAELKANLQPGDVVFYDWSKPQDGRHSIWTGNHVGIAKGLSGDDAVVIEHNTSVAGTRNQGTTTKVRDAKFIVAIGRPKWDAVSVPVPPRIKGTKLPLLKVDGSFGPSSSLALGTVMKGRGYAVAPSRTVHPDLVKAIQTELNKFGKRDKAGHKLAVDGKGFGSNADHRYPSTGSTHTIEALQIGHGVNKNKADGYFSKDDSSEVRRIQSDINNNGIGDSPLFTG